MAPEANAPNQSDGDGLEMCGDDLRASSLALRLGRDRGAGGLGATVNHPHARGPPVEAGT
jgi:hypothetical protein